MTQLRSLRGLSWWELAKRTCCKSWEDEVFGQSARLAFYFFFALFPALLLLLISFSISATGGSKGRAALLDSFAQALPPAASALIAKTVRELNARAVLGTAAIGAGAYAIWGALNGTWAVMTGLNKAYEVTEERPWWRVLLVMFGLTISLSVLYVIALAGIAYGDPAGDIVRQHLGTPAHFAFFWRALEWLVIILLLLFSFALIYRFGPNLKDRRWQWSIPGAVVAVALWVGFTFLLRMYQAHFSSSRIYGGLNAVTVLLMWLYMTGAAIYIGGEANSEIEKAAAGAAHSDARGARTRRSGGAGSSGA